MCACMIHVGVETRISVSAHGRLDEAEIAVNERAHQNEHVLRSELGAALRVHLEDREGAHCGKGRPVRGTHPRLDAARGFG